MQLVAIRQYTGRWVHLALRGLHCRPALAARKAAGCRPDATTKLCYQWRATPSCALVWR